MTTKRKNRRRAEAQSDPEQYRVTRKDRTSLHRRAQLQRESGIYTVPAVRAIQPGAEIRPVAAG